MTSITERDDLERRLATMLSDRAAAVEIHPDPDAAIDDSLTARGRQPRRRWIMAAAAAIIVMAIGLSVAFTARDSDSVETDTVPSTTAPSTVAVPVDSSPVTSPATLPEAATPAPIPLTTAQATAAFSAAIETSGLLASPTPDEVAQAMDAALYAPDSGQTDVSATGNYVSLRTCRFTLSTINNVEPSPRCPHGFPAGWAFEAGTNDGAVIRHGLLGQATNLVVSALDDRYFLAMERTPDVQVPSAWLIDAESGEVGPLSWNDTPTVLRSPAQALWLCQDGPSCPQPRVVDARDGTIRPLAVPADIAPSLPVAQPGRGRIWISTEPDGDQAWLAYSDDGGATWVDVALPEEMRATTEDGFSVAADGERLAATPGWLPTAEGRAVSVSNDAGRRWTTAKLQADPGDSNLGRLYVLADGRLVMRWSADAHPHQVLVSTGSDWAELDTVDALFGDPDINFGSRQFSVNQAGVALSTWTVNPCEVAGATCRDPRDEADTTFDVTTHYSSDLTNWSTVDSPQE